jgi:hypothetical protein
MVSGIRARAIPCGSQVTLGRIPVWAGRVRTFPAVITALPHRQEHWPGTEKRKERNETCRDQLRRITSTRRRAGCCATAAGPALARSRCALSPIAACPAKPRSGGRLVWAPCSRMTCRTVGGLRSSWSSRKACFQPQRVKGLGREVGEVRGDDGLSTALDRRRVEHGPPRLLARRVRCKVRALGASARMPGLRCRWRCSS